MRMPLSAVPLARQKIDSSFWFSGWTALEIDEVLAQSTLRRCAKSELVYRDGAANELILILSGSIWTCLRNDSEVIKFGIAYPATLIGLSRILNISFHDEPRYEFYTTEESEVLAIPAPAYLSRLESRPALWRSTAQAAILYQRHCIKLALVLYTGPTRDRLVSAIYQFGLSTTMKSSKSPGFHLAIPQEELAVLIQSSRQHVNRALRELECEGLIKVGYRRIEIIDAREIEQRALARFSDKALLDANKSSISPNSSKPLENWPSFRHGILINHVESGP